MVDRAVTDLAADLARNLETIKHVAAIVDTPIVVPFDVLHPPIRVTCHICGSQRLSRRDHPALEGESAACPECRAKGVES